MFVSICGYNELKSAENIPILNKKIINEIVIIFLWLYKYDFIANSHTIGKALINSLLLYKCIKNFTLNHKISANHAINKQDGTLTYEPHKPSVSNDMLYGISEAVSSVSDKSQSTVGEAIFLMSPGVPVSEIRL